MQVYVVNISAQQDSEILKYRESGGGGNIKRYLVV